MGIDVGVGKQKKVRAETRVYVSLENPHGKWFCQAVLLVADRRYSNLPAGGVENARAIFATITSRGTGVVANQGPPIKSRQREERGREGELGRRNAVEVHQKVRFRGFPLARPSDRQEGLLAHKVKRAT